MILEGETRGEWRKSCGKVACTEKRANCAIQISGGLLDRKIVPDSIGLAAEVWDRVLPHDACTDFVRIQCGLASIPVPRGSPPA